MARIIIPGTTRRLSRIQAAVATAARLLLSLSRQLLLHLTFRHPGKVLVALLLAGSGALWGTENLGRAALEAGEALALGIIRAVPADEPPSAGRGAEEQLQAGQQAEPERAATPAPVPSPVAADRASRQPEPESETDRLIREAVREAGKRIPTPSPSGSPAVPKQGIDEVIREAAEQLRLRSRPPAPTPPRQE